jgi:hypothetical protein
MKWNSKQIQTLLLTVCIGMLPLYFYAAFFAVESLFLGMVVYYCILLVIYFAISFYKFVSMLLKFWMRIKDEG